MSHEGGSLITLTIGVGLIGFTLSLLIYGITIGQAVLYMARYSRDYSTFWTRCLVVALWVVDTVHIFLLSSAMYYYCVSSRGDPSQFGYAVWSYGAISLLSESGSNLVRLGYAYKMWKFNNRRAILPIVVVVLSFLLFTMGMVFGIEELRALSFDQKGFQWTTFVSFAANTVSDTIIAIAMLMALRGFWTGLKRFDAIIQTILMYIVNTGIISVVLITVDLIMVIFFPTTFLYISVYWVLAKLHVCSFLAVLHAEKDLAERASTHVARDRTVMFTTALRIEAEHTGQPTQPETIELSDLSGSVSSQEPGRSNSEIPRECNMIQPITFAV